MRIRVEAGLTTESFDVMDESVHARGRPLERVFSYPEAPQTEAGTTVLSKTPAISA